MSRLSEAIEKYGKMTETKETTVKRTKYLGNGKYDTRRIPVTRKFTTKQGVDIKTINSLSKWDPSGNNKYLDWMLKMRTTSPLTLTNIKSFVKLYHDSPQKFKHSDLNKYKTATEVLLDYQEASTNLSKSEMKKLGVNVIAETDEFKLLEILTYKAAKIYGSNTKWCITSSDEHFDDYSYESNIYFYILKNTSIINDKTKTTIYHKLAILVEKDINPRIESIWSAEDNQVDPRIFKNGTYSKNHDILQICYDHSNKKAQMDNLMDDIDRIKRNMIQAYLTKTNISLIDKIIENLKENKL